MFRLRTNAVVVLAAVLASGCAATDEGAVTPAPDVDRAVRELVTGVTARLRSEDPATVAWGGYLAQRHRLKETAPELRPALARWSADPTEAGFFVRLSLLDALIQLDERVPASELVPFLEGASHDPAFVLLVRSSRANERALFEFFRTGIEAEAPAVPSGPGPSSAGRASVTWMAAGQQLAHQHARGFAALVLGKVRCRLRVIALGPDQEWFEAPSLGGRGVGCSYPRRRLPGFPPIPSYVLSSTPGAGMQLTFDGEAPVGCHRSEEPGALTTGTSWQPSEPLLWQWLEVLRHGFWDLRGYQGDWDDGEQIRFTSADDFRRQVEALRAAREALFHELVAALRFDGLLTPQEATELAFRLEVLIEDHRSNQTEPLPEIAGAKMTRHE